MDLSNDLVSQFAKITTGDKDKNNETTVYGTVKIYDGITCVKIDGSDLLTPVDTTTEVKEGERVTVLIKNHSAVITGNTSDPSAGLSTTDGISERVSKVVADIGVFENLTAENFKTTNAEIENLTAKNAQIENIVATKASISDLEAVQAKIKDLDVEYVNAELAEINEAIIKKADIELLNAETANINEALINKADVADLNALDAEINNLSSNFATIQQLNAANANINTLDAEVADIQTLVNGNLTSDNISSLNLTSANTTVDNAFIKDAMIDSVTASKLTAGIIDTSAITIKSKDGNMLITGSVQQFKDENGKVRIQIGKDSGGKFTFILYDESGTGVLIDENGIKSSNAIADGLIVDSKVAGNANISGSKLDIASVITEVNNDNSTTIKSNKIYLNEQGQSLEVAFNSLKTHVDTIQDESIDGDLTSVKEQVQSNTTQINVNTSGISTLVSQNEIRKEEIKNLDDEITEVSTDINSKYTSLQQDLSGFKTTVGETYTTKSEFNNLNVGGTNLLPNSKTLSGWGTEGVLQDGYYDGTFTGAFMSYTGTSGYNEVLYKNSFLKLEPNTQYTLSFWARGNGKFYSYLYKTGTTVVSNGYNSSGATTTYPDGSIITTLTNESVLTRYWITWTTSNSITKDTLLNLIPVRVAAELGNCSIVICGIKLEKGNKETDWSPSPEDIQDAIDSVSNDLTANYSTTSQMNSSINQKANEITSSVSQTYATKQSVTDVSNNLKNNYSTTSAMNSAINQKANEITSAVSETYTTKSEFNNLSVGGTNLYPNSNFKETVTGRENTETIGVTYSDAVESNQKRYGGKILQLYNGGSSTSDPVDNYYTLNYQLTLEPNTTYTLSYDYFDAGLRYGNSGCIYLWGTFNNISTRQIIPLSHTVYGDKKRRRHTQTFTTNSTRLIFELRFGFTNTAAYWLAIEGIKLEKGNKATDWSPSPEDIQGRIDTVSNNLAINYSTTSQMNSAINQKANEITSSVSQTYATKQSVTDVSNNLKNNYSTTSAMNSSINQKANEITSSVSQTYATKSEFNNLNVGGRNLIETPNETRVYSSTGVSGTFHDTFSMITTIIPTGTEYIVSFEAKASANMTCKCFFYDPNTTFTSESSTGYKETGVADGFCLVDITTSWKRYWVKWTQTAASAKKSVIVGRNETAGVTLEIRAVKFEEGNKPTAWSPAPELATNSINALTTRMQTAESKLTKDSLTTTIGDYYATESKISSYGYATTSQVTQTKNDLTATFKSIGGYNLIKNSCGYGGTRGWVTDCNIYNVYPSSHARSVGFNAILYITNTDTSEKYAFSPRFKLKPNTTYTLSGYIWKNSNVSSYEAHILTSTDVDESNTDLTFTNVIICHYGTAPSPTYFEKTFTTVANTMSGFVRIDHNGYNNSGGTTNCNVHFTGLCLVEGSVAKPWSPHPSETYSASTIVDANGVKVTHTNAVGYTQMDANGFYLNDGSKNVLSVTSSGASFNMPISANLIRTGTLDASKVTVTNLSASSITTGTFSGNRISGGKITATDEISFVGGARIFGNEGDTGTGLTVSAGGIVLGGGSVNYLQGSWFVQLGDLEIEGGDLVLNSGGTIDCYDINSTAITCTSVTASSNINCAGIIHGRGNTALNREGMWTALDGSLTRDTIRFNNNILTSDSSSSKIYLLNTKGDFCTLRAARVESGGDVTCWDLWAGGKVYANNVALTSDKRLKTDIRYVNIDQQSIGESGLMSPNVNITTKDMLEFIESIPFASYRMKNEVEKDIDYTYYGFIAQDLLETKVGSELIEYSEVIVENKSYDDEGRELIDYTTEDRLRYSENKFIAFLAGALQEEIHQRKLLEKEIKNLKEGK